MIDDAPAVCTLTLAEAPALSIRWQTIRCRRWRWCVVTSLFVHVTVVPTATLIGFGEKAVVVSANAPFTIDALAVVPVGVGVAVGEVELIASKTQLSQADVIACNSSTSPTATPTPTGTTASRRPFAERAFALTTTAFSPNPINVAVGTTVTWTNNDVTTTAQRHRRQRIVRHRIDSARSLGQRQGANGGDDRLSLHHPSGDGGDDQRSVRCGTPFAD